MITVLHRGGLTKWLQYWGGMVVVVVKSVFTFEFTTTTTKTMIWNVAFIQGFQHCLNWICIFVANALCRNLHVIFVFSGGYGQMITILHRRGSGQMITILHRGGGGVFRTPKSDYVICARPLIEKLHTSSGSIFICYLNHLSVNGYSWPILNDNNKVESKCEL